MDSFPTCFVKNRSHQDKFLDFYEENRDTLVAYCKNHGDFKGDAGNTSDE